VDLREFHVRHLPGLPAPFSLRFAPGFNILSGPNGSGKSLVTRALASLLWPTLFPPDLTMEVRAIFTGPEKDREVVGHGGIVRWISAGEAASAPDLPGDHLAACLHLDILDLIGPEPGEDDRALARRLAADLAGGVDAPAIRRDLRASTGPKVSTLEKALRQARRHVDEVQGAQRILDGPTAS